ncbi:MAG: metallophosphoesterase [Candidatus Moranbacteria bacterium]|nr:metallophosphoesterase [Candidatus Moranbacteria bacterium]
MNKKYLFIIFGIITIFSLSGFFVYSFVNEKNTEELITFDETKIEDENKLTQNDLQNYNENIITSANQKNIQTEISNNSEDENSLPILDSNKKTEELKDKELNLVKKVEEIKTYKSFNFVVIADSESYKAASGHEEKFESMLAKTVSYKPDFVIFSGDLITQGSPDRTKVANLKKLIRKYYSKFYITFGKHDIECGVQCVDIWEDVFFNKKHVAGEKRKLYYSFDYENTHFVLLSSDYPIKHSVDDVQLKWLNDDLKKNDKSNIIVVVHVPSVTFFKESAKECHDMSCNETQRVKLINFLKKHKVDLVISGHEHVFDHKIVDGIDFVIAGGVGKSKRYKDSMWKDSFLQITVSGNRIILKSFGIEGELIREIKIK